MPDAIQTAAVRAACEAQFDGAKCDYPACICGRETARVRYAPAVLAAVEPLVREACARVADAHAEFRLQEAMKNAKSGRVLAHNEDQTAAVCLIQCAAAIRAMGEKQGG